MSYAKSRRQQAIVDLLRSGAIASQQQLAARLLDQGYQATQATVSRDLEQIGAIKVRRGGKVVYALPAQAGEPAAAPRYQALLRDYARSIEAAANLVVIRTPPGSAHLIGVALDHSSIDGLVGTICGDDTIFAACPSSAAAARLAEQMRALAA